MPHPEGGGETSESPQKLILFYPFAMKIVLFFKEKNPVKTVEKCLHRAVILLNDGGKEEALVL